MRGIQCENRGCNAEGNHNDSGCRAEHDSEHIGMLHVGQQEQLAAAKAQCNGQENVSHCDRCLRHWCWNG